VAESLGRAAKAVRDEATGKPRVFVWNYKVETDDGGTEDRQLELVIPRKYKRFKFARKLASGDVMSALELVFGVEAVSDLEDLEMDDDEFDLFMERLGEALGGTSAKN
jgi:hypothetical protein